MCGRYSLTADTDALVEVFEVPTWPEPALELPRYNIAPTQFAPALILGPEGRRLGSLRWGLIPFWAKDPSIGSRLINARSETVRSKPAFRDAFERRRCLIPADGFYEWRAEAGPRRPKTPYWVHRPDRRTFTFAGLWERWRSPEGPPLHSFTVLTTDANRWIAPLHDRMPVVIRPEDRDTWMAADSPVEALVELLTPAPEDLFAAFPVSPAVNKPANEVAQCIDPVGPLIGPADEWPKDEPEELSLL